MSKGVDNEARDRSGINRLPMFENNLFMEGQSVVESDVDGDDKLMDDNISNNSAFRLH